MKSVPKKVIDSKSVEIFKNMYHVFKRYIVYKLGDGREIWIIELKSSLLDD